jgi:hypothetical protein
MILYIPVNSSNLIILNVLAAPVQTLDRFLTGLKLEALRFLEVFKVNLLLIFKFVIIICDNAFTEDQISILVVLACNSCPVFFFSYVFQVRLSVIECQIDLWSADRNFSMLHPKFTK